MELSINCISADAIMRARKDSDEVMRRMTISNPQFYALPDEGVIFFDLKIILTEGYSITSRFEGETEFIKIKLSNLGDLELKRSDFREMVIY